MKIADPHFPPRDHAARWRALADCLRADPAGFDIALENIDRWERLGRTHPAALQAWRGKIHEARSSPEAINSLLDWMAEDNTDAEPLKSCSPFVGVEVATAR